MKYKITGSVTILGSGVNVHIKSLELLGDKMVAIIRQPAGQSLLCVKRRN